MGTPSFLFVGRTISALAIGFAGLCALACLGGESLSERRAGGDTWVEPVDDPDGGVTTGAIAVDPVRETTYVLQASGGLGTAQRRRSLLAVDPDQATTRTVASLDGTTDVRVLFPSGGVLVMAERGGRDQLSLFDPDSLALRLRVDPAVRYHGTRMSPSRRFVAVADNTSDQAPIHVIEGDTLRTTIIPHDGGWLEAMWQNTRDRLVAMVSYGGERPSMRFMVFDMNRVRDDNYAADGDFWRAPVLNVRAPDTQPAQWFSWSWVSVSPDDRYAVFPVEDVGAHGSTAPTPGLYVMNLTTGALRWVENAWGPVGISPDGSTIVAYRTREKVSGESAYDLVLVDEATLRRDEVRLPFGDRPVYHTTRTGHRVVLTALTGGGAVRVYDFQMRSLTALEGASVSLADEFAVRSQADELWVVSGGLHRVALGERRVESVGLGWSPAHLNILPQRDLLVLDVPGQNELRYWSPATRTVTRRVALPQPPR